MTGADILLPFGADQPIESGLVPVIKSVAELALLAAKFSFQPPQSLEKGWVSCPLIFEERRCVMADVREIIMG